MGNSSNRSEIIFTAHLVDDLKLLLTRYPAGKVFLATEANVHRLWLGEEGFFSSLPQVVLPPGEENKNISSVSTVWEFLSSCGADRKSLLINAGGGMLTDLCGFAASTFKRGIDFINIPTTLLSQVDASVGGKTGINFHGLKNEIGTFNEPLKVLIHTPFLKTIDTPNFLSGYAEMIKHGLIFNAEHLAELEKFNLDTIDYASVEGLIRHSVEVKKHFVEKDPLEKNIRKALNFGHTVGHAIESLAMEQKRPVLHGYAVAWGMITELFLSSRQCGFPFGETLRLSQWLKSLYGSIRLATGDFDRIFRLMQHDKKNDSNLINFTLLPVIGSFEINQNCSKDSIYDSLTFLQEI